MNEKIKNVQFISVSDLVDTEKYKENGAYFCERFGIMMNFGDIPENEWMNPYQPYRSKEWRIARITSGVSKYIINLQEHVLRKNTIHILPPGTLVMKVSESDDHSAEFLSIYDLDELNSRIPQGHTLYYTADEKNGKRFHEYFKLILQMAQDPRTPFASIRLTVLALAEDMIAQQEVTMNGNNDKSKHNRHQLLHNRFMEMLNREGTVKHEIAFYADRLFVTPNYLSKVVKETSGQTVSWWINYMVVMEAKMLLLHSNLQVSEIADRLGFPNLPFFSRFFKRETGMTAVAFQKGIRI